MAKILDPEQDRLREGDGCPKGADAPDFSGDPNRDRDELCRLIKGYQLSLSQLPSRPHRTAAQDRSAVALYDAERVVRRRFLTVHASWLYRKLTEDFSIYRRITDIVYAAAELCPGLVPSLDEMASEAGKQQCDKEGLEIDQGILLQHWLSDPVIGPHLAEAMLLPTNRAIDLVDQFLATGKCIMDTLVLERNGCAGHITRQNVSCLNAEDNSSVEDMETAVDLVLLDPSIKVGVVRGGIMTHPRYVGRRVFSAGINLKHLYAGKISFLDFLMRRELGYISKIRRGLYGRDVRSEAARSILEHEKPWLAVVDSFAIGGGGQLLLVFDKVVAVAGSYVTIPAAREGIVPGFANLRLTPVTGARVARQILLSGRKIWAHERQAELLVDEVAEATQLEELIDQNVADLATPAVAANRHMLNLAEEPLDVMLRYAADFAYIQVCRLYSEDVLTKAQFA